MRSVGAFEAKTHLSALLDEVEGGAVIIITRHGKPIARLVPVGGGDPGQRQRLVAAWRKRRRKLRLGDLDARALIEEGRR